MLSSTYKKQVTDLFASIDKDDEFEVMFNNYKQDSQLPLIDFMNCLKYIKYRSTNDKLKLYETISLDVYYNEYRISINGANTINNFLGLVYQKKNNNIFSILVSQYLDKDNFKLIKKIKERTDKVDVDNLNIRFRKSKESDVTDDSILEMLKNIPNSDTEKIVYRYKQRITLELSKNLVIDLTIVKTSNNIANIATASKIYEVEIDYSPNKVDLKILPEIFNEMSKIKKVLSGCDIILTKDEETKIIERYKQLTFGNTHDQSISLYTMQPISAEVQHIVDNIPNKYSVTDKADGEKYQLYIYEGESYLISNNLHIIKLNNPIKNLDNTIIEGELIFLSDKTRKYIFMMFDCLFFKGEDYRNIIELKKRLIPLKEVSNKYGAEPYIVKDFSQAFNISNIRKYYSESIKSFYTSLNKELDKLENNQVLFYPKLFLFPTGGSSSECFLFSDLIWINCTKNTNIDCPYLLDGIIFTSVEQKYSKDKKDQRHPTYKYKPPQTNSLDVYITFEKNKETGGYMDFYDNTIENKLPFKNYRIINLFVGENVGGKEIPVPFMKEQLNNTIYLPIIDNVIRDVEGNLIQDKTVVEIIYTNDINIPHPYRWSILRTRWDKTDSVLKHGKKYGNYKDIAEKIWKSMTEAVTIDEINNLSNPTSYDMQMKLLRSRLDSSVIISQRKQDIYYQKISTMVSKLRKFHNWIKSIIINTYCAPTAHEVGGKLVRQSLLDIGCGRGGDILKMYHARVGEYVGVDPDFEGIYSATDGAISRFQFFKKKYPEFGKVTYIQADGSVPFTSEAQNKSIANLSNENKETIDRIFTSTRKFDNISSQFVIHYLFGTKIGIDNLISNIKNYLKKDGYILLTLFDTERIEALFDINGKITATYTDVDGKRNILYEIIKKYGDKLHNNVGSPIDVHMSWISEEGKYIEEYLVPKKLMIDTMKKAGCELIDSELFENIFQLNKPYFNNVIKYEENPKNKKVFDEVAEFYQNLTGADKESKNYSFLFRYYIFQKIIK